MRRFIHFLFLLLTTCSLGAETVQPYYTLDSNLSRGYGLFMKGDYDEAAKQYLLGLKNAQKAGNKRIEAEAYRDLGEVNRASQNRAIALKYLLQAEKIFSQTDDQYGLASTKNRLAAVYFEMRNFALCETYLKSSARISEKGQYLEILANNLTIQGVLEYHHKKNFRNSLECFQKAYVLAQNLGSDEDYPYIFNNMVASFRSLGMMDSALYYAELSLEISKRNQVKAYLGSAYGQLAILYAQMGNYQKAFEYQVLNGLYIDSIYGESRDAEVAEILERYQNEKHETKLQDQQEKLRYSALILLVFLFLLLVLVVLFLNLRKRGKSLEIARIKTEVQSRQLEENNRLKDRLLSVLSHDLRSPLAALSSSLELLRSDELSREESMMLMDELSIRLERTSELLDNLLFWIRKQSDRLNPVPQSVSLLEEANRVVLLQESAIQKKQLKVEISIPEELTIHADKEIISLALRNLLSNSIKFSHSGGRIVISAQKWDRYTELIVSDEGIGMDKEQIARIFDIRQFSSAGTYNEVGMGLGLSIVREFVEANGGEIKVNSEPGRGSSFYLRFPV